jgi:hypothetical protein
MDNLDNDLDNDLDDYYSELTNHPDPDDLFIAACTPPNLPAFIKCVHHVWY